MIVSHPPIARALRAACGAAVAASMLCSGSASAIGLVKAYEAALKNDPTFRSAFYENEGGKEYRIMGRSNLLPAIQANYSGNKNRADITSPNIFTGALGTSHPDYSSKSSSVQLRQPLFSLDAYARYKQGVAQSDYSQATFESRKQDLVLRLVGAYTDALFASEQLALSKSQFDALHEQASVNNRLFEKGEGTKTDMLETQARLDVAEAQVIESDDNLKAALATLSGVVGEEVSSVDELGPDFVIPPLLPASFEAWRDIAMKNNPDLQAQEFGVEAARQEIMKARAGHTPRVDFIAAYSKSKSESITTLNQDSTVRSLGVQVNIPIYSGGMVSATTRQAVAGMEKAKADLQAKKDKLLVEVSKQYGIALSSVTRTAALTKAVKSSKLLITATEQSIKGGVRINLDLLNAQQQLFTNQRDLAQAKFNYLASVLRLRAAAGNLTSGDVAEVATYFR